jgi:hypothetical protein
MVKISHTFETAEAALAFVAGMEFARNNPESVPEEDVWVDDEEPESVNADLSPDEESSWLEIMHRLNGDVKKLTVEGEVDG